MYVLVLGLLVGQFLANAVMCRNKYRLSRRVGGRQSAWQERERERERELGGGGDRLC